MICDAHATAYAQGLRKCPINILSVPHIVHNTVKLKGQFIFEIYLCTVSNLNVHEIGEAGHQWGYR